MHHVTKILWFFTETGYSFCFRLVFLEMSFVTYTIVSLVYWSYKLATYQIVKSVLCILYLSNYRCKVGLNYTLNQRSPYGFISFVCDIFTKSLQLDKAWGFALSSFQIIHFFVSVRSVLPLPLYCNLKKS